jgi:hypothetical protein
MGAMAVEVTQVRINGDERHRLMLQDGAVERLEKPSGEPKRLGVDHIQAIARYHRIQLCI